MFKKSEKRNLKKNITLAYPKVMYLTTCNIHVQITCTQRIGNHLHTFASASNSILQKQYSIMSYTFNLHDNIRKRGKLQFMWQPIKALSTADLPANNLFLNINKSSTLIQLQPCALLRNIDHSYNMTPTAFLATKCLIPVAILNILT
jgi:hypothetical protein